MDISKTVTHDKKENLIEQARGQVSGFQSFYEKLRQKIVVAGKSGSTLLSYGSHLAKLALRFGQVLTEIDPDQINGYLYLVKKSTILPQTSTLSLR